MFLLNTLIGSLTVGLTAAAPLQAVPAAIPSRPTTEDELFKPSVAARAWKTIVLHHSATRGGNVASIDAVHRQQKDRAGNPWLGIGYHFVVGNGQKMGDGEIRPTFRWLKQLPGAHAGQRDYNEQGIGICLIGNFDDTPPTDKQLLALQGLLKTLAQQYEIPRQRVLRHAAIQATLCPGRLFPWEQTVASVPLDFPPKHP